MDDPEDARQTLQELENLGISLSLDDFGTGYSSLNYLRRFPVDSLKIDQSFISDVITDPSGVSVVASIIDIAHNLKLTAIAEGVETQEQLEFSWSFLLPETVMPCRGICSASRCRPRILCDCYNQYQLLKQSA